MSNRESLQERQERMKARIKGAPARDLAPKYRRQQWSRPNSNRTSPGWVYVIRMGANGPYKIGCTLESDPIQRITRIDQSLPYPIDVVALARTNNAGGLELRLHRIFERDRLKGEWFQLSDKDVHVIFKMEGFGEPKLILQQWRSALLQAISRQQ